MTWNDYIQKSGIEEYAAYERAVAEGGALFLETPDPLPVRIHKTLVCAEHPDCRLISYPREEGAENHVYNYKCPWKFCSFGV